MHDCPSLCRWTDQSRADSGWTWIGSNSSLCTRRAKLDWRNIGTAQPPAILSLRREHLRCRCARTLRLALPSLESYWRIRTWIAQSTLESWWRWRIRVLVQFWKWMKAWQTGGWKALASHGTWSIRKLEKCEEPISKLLARTCKSPSCQKWRSWIIVWLSCSSCSWSVFWFGFWARIWHEFSRWMISRLPFLSSRI